MGFLKKNIVFSIVVLICLSAFAVGAYFAFAESAKISRAEQAINSAKSQLQGVLNAEPAPTEANIEASAANARELRAKLETMRDDLEQGSRLKTSSDGIQVMASIQQFISDYQKKARENITADEVAAPIQIPDSFAFGFEQYIDEATIPDDPDVIPVLDKQRQILIYLLNKLFSADPHSIVSVKREVIENKAKTAGATNQNKQADRQSFRLSPAISARVPGAIETLAFSLTFTGYTDSLREFLNGLGQFDLPIVIRSIEVKRATTKMNEQRPAANANNLEAIFGVFGEDAGATPAPALEEEQKPVIEENVSSFTVILEFIEIVLPEVAAE